jgi:hypothetical protein
MPRPRTVQGPPSSSVALSIIILLLFVVPTSLTGGSGSLASTTDSNAVRALESSLPQRQEPSVSGAIAPAGGEDAPTDPVHPLPALCSTVRPSEALPWEARERALRLHCASEAESLVPSLTVSGSGWSEPASSSPPDLGLYNQFLTYDSSDGYLLFFGATGTGALNGTETWSYSNGSWNQIATSTAPESCSGSSLAYDSADGYVVYLGGGPVGGAGCTSSGQTWSYHHGVWTQLHPTHAPPARQQAGFTNDSADGYLLLFGGLNGSRRLNDTWSFVAGNWTNRTSTVAPSPRSEPGLSYDASDGYVVLFGGSANIILDDTWTYHAGVWKLLNPVSGPPPQDVDALAYDAGDGIVVYTEPTNASSNSNAMEDTWSYHGGNWTHLVASNGTVGTAPPSSYGAETAYDWSEGYFVFYGGVDFNWVANLSVWSLHSGAWTNRGPATPPPRSGAAMAFDAADGYLLLFGGSGGSTDLMNPTFFHDTWSWSDGRWTQIATNASPPARGDGMLAYDASDGYALLFGGYAGSGGWLNDTWEFTDGGWSEITPAVSPPSGGGFGDSSMVYDASDGYILLVDSAATVTDWTYHAGVWTNITDWTRTAIPIPDDPLVYDSTSDRVFLFGTVAFTGPNEVGEHLTSETWTFFDGNWTNDTTTAGSPPPAEGSAMVADDPPDHGVLLFGGGNYDNDTWVFGNGSWKEQLSVLVPPGRAEADGAYDPTSQVDVMFGGAIYSTDEQDPPNGCVVGYYEYYCGDTWDWSPSGVLLPSVSSFTADPNPVDEGQSVVLSVGVFGGTLPYTYSFAGLPPGCVSANQSSLTCPPTTAGNFSVTVHVTDSAGVHVDAELELTVRPALTLVSFVALPSQLATGGRTLLAVTVDGGSGAVQYTYSDLPPGCSTQSVPTLPCAPDTSGNFSIQVVAVDVQHSSVTASVTLTVTPAGVSGGLVINSFALDPPTLHLGNSTTILVNATGGRGPLTYTYVGLPTGCVSENVSSLGCTPTSAGTFGLSLYVEDPSGDSASVGTNLTVFPVGGGGGALISSFSATPSRFVLGNSTSIVVAATGGTPPLSYSYPVLPPGCHGEDTAVLPCTPSSAGNFSVYVLVQDAAGNRSGAFGSLTVVRTSNTTVPPVRSIVPPPGSQLSGGFTLLGLDLGSLLAVSGAIVLGVLLALGITEVLVRRRALRREGDEIVRGLSDRGSEPRPPRVG